MSLTIRKLGNKNFRHEDANFADYGANDITVIIEGNIFKFRSFSGRIVLKREGYNFNDISVIDDDNAGSVETFASANALKQRLINLGYPFAGGTTDIDLTSIDGGTP